MTSFNANRFKTSRWKIAGMLALFVLLSTTHAATVHGVVRKLSDSTTLAGAKVYYLNAGVRAESTTTDANGTYWLRNVPLGGNRLVVAEFAGYAKSYLSVSISSGNAEGEGMAHFFLGAPGSLVGVVRRATDSVALGGAVVYLRRHTYLTGSSVTQKLDSTVTNLQGVYVFNNVAPGSPNYSVTAVAPGFAETTTSNIPLANGGATGSDIHILALGKVTAQVRKLPDSTFVANALVLLRQGNSDTSAVLDSGRTDALGTFTFSNLSATTGGSGQGTGTLYRVYANANGYAEVKKTGMYVTNGSNLVANLTFTTTVSISQGPGLSSPKTFTATRAGTGWLIRLPAAASNRTFTLHDARGVVLHRTLVPAGATELVIPGTATQAGVMMRLD
jgi:hypothetical protein